jgi:hypothetical protein
MGMNSTPPPDGQNVVVGQSSASKETKAKARKVTSKKTTSAYPKSPSPKGKL